jgi:hypothetical protein
LFELFERLQDNMHLLPIDGVNTSMPSLLSGFPKDMRETIVRRLSAILNELATVHPEEFFMSPSHMQEYVQPHNDLRQSLSLCLSLCHMAIPLDELEKPIDNHWHLLPEIQIALGLVIKPDYSSPIIRRGGDTSVFSLPSDSNATPMTSNVSLSSTITTAKTVLRLDRTALMKTIHSVATLFETLSVCCRDLSQWETDQHMNVKASVRVTSQIKKTYNQMMGLRVDDLMSVVEAFELRQCQHNYLYQQSTNLQTAILRQVSEDYEGKGAPIVPLNIDNSTLVDIQQPTAYKHVSYSCRHCADESFSPCTLDMASQVEDVGDSSVNDSKCAEPIGAPDCFHHENGEAEYREDLDPLRE